MHYRGVHLKDEIVIDELFTIHYFEYMNDFTFEGESHDFWEFICVDKGVVGITANRNYSVLKKGEIAFHQPNEFHQVMADGENAPNLVVVSFSTRSRAMNFFPKKILKIDELERNLLASIIVEARRAFSCRLDDPYLSEMKRTSDESFGSEQLIRIYLEHFLLHLIRRYSHPLLLEKKAVSGMQKVTKSRSDIETFHRVLEYLEEHIADRLTIEQICKDNIVGRSQLQKIFQEQVSLGIIEYFSKLKIDTAKQLIRTNRMNFTQISERLGYTSIHYFSRQFKKITNMTPSEYASSIKAMADNNNS